jgi:hypothetical protein
MRRSLLPASMALCATGLALVLSVAGCGSATSPPSGSASSVTTTGQEPATPTVSPSKTATVTSTVSGVVANDAPDGHCRTMVVEGRTLQLVGSLAELAPGSRVTLEGHEDRGMMTACQMGTPFVVDRVLETGK